MGILTERASEEYYDGNKFVINIISNNNVDNDCVFKFYI